MPLFSGSRSSDFASIYLFFSEIMDERGVLFSLKLHPPGICFKLRSKRSSDGFCLISMSFSQPVYKQAQRSAI